MSRHNNPYFYKLTPEGKIGHYCALVRFWTSVFWHYPSYANKQVLAQNIGKLREFNKRRSEQ